MEKKNRLSPMAKVNFDNLIAGLNLPANFHHDFIFEIYEAVLEALGQVEQKSDLLKMEIVDHPTIIYYLVGEHYYNIYGGSPEKILELEANEKYQSFLLSSTLDKYLTNGHLEYKLGNYYSQFSPPISSLELYLNFTLGILNRFKKKEPDKTLIVDIITKGLSLGKGIINLLKNGFETEAFATWRTLHETESVLLVLDRYQAPAINAYLRHLNYGLAFRHGISDKTLSDATFAQIKTEMHALDLKSKDMKRFIEYGWLLAIPGVKENANFKYNFRDGLELIAGLASYSKTYEMASEVAHSSPILIYAKNELFGSLALLNLYESFFRMEEVFRRIYLSVISEAEQKQYEMMRAIYYRSMLNILDRERQKYLKKFGRKKED